jgi:alkylated DNA repair dioxygenase AlkB
MAEEVMDLALANPNSSFKVVRDSLNIEYWADFLTAADATGLLDALLNETPWVHPELMMYGKRVKMPRLTCWYGDPTATYVYSGVRNEPLPWDSRLSNLRDKVQEAVGTKFNSVLLNLYRDGNDYMSWHRDDEPELGLRPVIASVSLGAVRKFDFRRVRNDSTQTRKTYSIELAHGSLLLMRDDTQIEWEHGITKARNVRTPRINLTFRSVLPRDLGGPCSRDGLRGPPR